MDRSQDSVVLYGNSSRRMAPMAQQALLDLRARSDPPALQGETAQLDQPARKVLPVRKELQDFQGQEFSTERKTSSTAMCGTLRQELRA